MQKWPIVVFRLMIFYARKTVLKIHEQSLTLDKIIDSVEFSIIASEHCARKGK